MNFTIATKTIRQTQIPFFPTTAEGGIESKPKALTAKWTNENGRLICQWINQ